MVTMCHDVKYFFSLLERFYNKYFQNLSHRRRKFLQAKATINCAGVQRAYITKTGSGTVSLSLGKKEGNVLFNDALNTFYLRLYGIR